MTPTPIPVRPDEPDLITRREAVRRVTALLGGITLVGGSALLTGCRDGSTLGAGERFSAEDIAFLDELAETILPATRTPGAKAAQTGAFMALMVTDSYDASARQVFRAGMRAVDKSTRKVHGTTFMTATPEQRLAVLQVFDRAQMAEHEARDERKRLAGLKTLDSRVPTPAEASGTKQTDAYLPDQRKENAPGTAASAAATESAEPPAHFFRMMKELALLGYFTSEIGYTQAQRYTESPGRYEPCVPLVTGDVAWAAHA